MFAKFSSDCDLIGIIHSLMQSSDPKYKKSAIKKLFKSEQFGPDIQEDVVHNLSRSFTHFLSSPTCPLRSQDFFSNKDKIDTLDLSSLLGKCKMSCPQVVTAIGQVLLGVGKDHDSTRLLTLLTIGAVSQNQKINLVPKLLGEFLKRKNCSKQGLELLQRCGVTLVSKSVARDQDTIGQQFLSDVKKRRQEIEEWVARREVLTNMVITDMMKVKTRIDDVLKVKFIADEFAIKMCDLGDTVNVLSPLDSSEVDERIIIGSQRICETEGRGDGLRIETFNLEDGIRLSLNETTVNNSDEDVPDEDLYLI